MSIIYNTEQHAERAREHTAYPGNIPHHNGIDRILVTIEPGFAWLDVEFFNNTIALEQILEEFNDGVKTATQIFSISGGSRIPAGEAFGQVQVVRIIAGSAGHILRLKVAPVGDYSTYTLSFNTEDYLIDPVFAEATFKFRPGCFNSNCAPLSNYKASNDEPAIDYLAKDFDSFKHVLLNAMRERVPGWQPTSEADLDQVLLDLIAADADELSDYQDRVMNEAYLGRVRKRVSLARHARLMDYHIHQGNQASTWLAVKVRTDYKIEQGLGVWTGDDWKEDSAVIFMTAQAQECFTALNDLYLYTWDGVVSALEAGATEADLSTGAEGMNEGEADILLTRLRREDVTHILLEQKLNPETGTENGLDKTARQVMQLLTGDAAAEKVLDPVKNKWCVRVRWQEQDKLQRRYCFITECPDRDPIEGVSAFHANLVRITHGRPHTTVFRTAGTELGTSFNDQFIRTDERHYETSPWGTVCALPHSLLAYKNTRPGGDKRTYTSLEVNVSGHQDPWEEQADLIESRADDKHYIVETDESGYSIIRFGNNVNGFALPDNSVVTCHYQIGRGSSGNTGSDALTGFDDPGGPGDLKIEKLWNPLDVTDGRDPEKQEQIIRRVPEAYRARQLRAITLEDYVKRAEELEEVSHAHARYAWTGSWRTVRISIDPKDTIGLSDELREKIARHLNAVRLIGEDLEIRGAQYVPLDIKLRVCAHPAYWPEHLVHELAAEFSDSYTVNGRMGFFHPELWTFGQALHASQITGRALIVKGVERVLMLSIRRWYVGSGAGVHPVPITPDQLPENEIKTLTVKPYEVIQVANDPSHLENGRMQFEIVGGRR